MTIERKLGGGRASYSRKADIITRIQMIRCRHKSLDEAIASTKNYSARPIEELKSILKAEHLHLKHIS